MTSQPSFPKIDLSTFFLSISSAAFYGMGIAPPGMDEKPQIDLELARHNIDLLELMEEKTRGNRSTEENKLIEQLLFETRMRFVEIERRTKG